MQPVFTIAVDAALLGTALGIGQADVRAIMTDARTATPIVQRRIAVDHPDWTLAAGAGGSEELRDPAGVVWRVKSITNETNFPPSKQIGSGRSVDMQGVAASWQALGGYILLDIATFPDIQVYRVPIAYIERWNAAGRLGTTAKASRVKLLTQLLPEVRIP